MAYHESMYFLVFLPVVLIGYQLAPKRVRFGVLLFFNHFGHLKLSDDPTPMQVQMRTYEDDVNQTLIEQAERTENPEKEA